MDDTGVVLNALMAVELRTWSGTPEHFQELMDDNLVLLRALLSLDTPASAQDEREGLRDLHIKLDLLLLLGNTALRSSQTLPPISPCALRSDGLRWRGPRASYPADAPLYAALYLHSRWAFPLCLPGTVIAPGTQDPLLPEADVLWALQFSLPPVVQDFLDRLIFRHHRRSIALRKDATS